MAKPDVRYFIAFAVMSMEILSHSRPGHLVSSGGTTMHVQLLLITTTYIWLTI